METIAFEGELAVRIHEKSYDKIFGYCDAAKSEVSGMGLVEVKNGMLEIGEVFLLEQECTSIFTELNDESVSKLMYELYKRKIPQSKLKLWWHTHFNFGCGWSGTDENNIKQLIGSSGDWFLSLVVNQRHEHKMRLDVLNPVHITSENLVLRLARKQSERVREKCKEEVQQKVKEKKYEYATYRGYQATSHDKDVPDWLRSERTNRYNHGYMEEQIWDATLGRFIPVSEYNRLCVQRGKERLETEQKQLPLIQDNENKEHPPYVSEAGHKMVWVEELRCHVPEGHENDQVFSYDDKEMSRAQLRSAMLDKEIEKELEAQYYDGLNGY